MTILDNMNEFIVRFEGPSESKQTMAVRSIHLSLISFCIVFVVLVICLINL